MFDSKKTKILEEKVFDLSFDISAKIVELEYLRSENKKMKDEAQKNNDAHEYALNNAKMHYDNTIRNTVAQHEIELSRIKNSEDIAVSKATSKIKDEAVSLHNQVSILSTKVEMYEEAFRNLGFDVKDMRDILNKLVDGIVQKNSINIVK